MTDFNIKISADFKDKRFSFFAYPHEIKNECKHILTQYL